MYYLNSSHISQIVCMIFFGNAALLYTICIVNLPQSHANLVVIYLKKTWVIECCLFQSSLEE